MTIRNLILASAAFALLTFTAAPALAAQCNMPGGFPASHFGAGAMMGTYGLSAAIAEGSNAVKGNAAADKGKKSGKSGVIVEASLDASGLKQGERGGSIEVLGDDIAILNGTIMDATGHSGLSGTTDGKLVSDVREGSAGGDIRIGGDYLGGGNTAAAQNLMWIPIRSFTTML